MDEGYEVTTSFEQLMAEHDRIDRLTLALEDCCARPMPDTYAVIQARSLLRTVLEAHLAREDEALYPGLLAAGGYSLNAIGRIDSAFVQLRVDWADYLTDWNAECLDADWATFQRETASLMARVRDRTALETAVLYPLALKTSAIGLRVA